MEVQIVNPLAIRAAATLANAGYTASVFQVRREGGDARVSGTHGYASISVLVPAKFNRWPDGKSLTFSGAAVRSMMRGIGRSLKTASFAKLSFSGGFVSASTEGEGTTTPNQVRCQQGQLLRQAGRLRLDEGRGQVECRGRQGQSAQHEACQPSLRAVGAERPGEVGAWKRRKNVHDDRRSRRCPRLRRHRPFARELEKNTAKRPSFPLSPCSLQGRLQGESA